MKTILAFLFLNFVVINAFGQIPEFEFNEFMRNKTDEQSHNYDIDRDILTNILNSNKFRLLEVPLDGKSASDLILKKIPNIIDNSTEFFCGNEKTDPPDIVTFSGFVEGKPGVKALITIINGYFFAAIENQSYTKYILPTFDQGVYSFCNYFDMNHSNSLNEDDHPFDFDQITELQKRFNSEELLLSNDLLELELAIETDTEFFMATGNNLEKAQAYILTLLTQVSKIYQNFINVRIKVSWLKTWTDNPSDPYDAKGDYAVLRDRAMAYWNDNYQDVERDVYHVCTSISYGGGGFGYFDALCGKKAHGMSVTSLQGWNNLPTCNFSYDIYILAHELGHNFNAQHTHSCFWNNAPLDTCVVDYTCLPENQQPLPNQGSIMSYCGHINNQSGFGYRVLMIFREENIKIMRATAEEATCLSKISEPLVELISPVGTEIYENIDTLKINWVSYNTNDIDLYFSSDAGIQWNIIEENIDPSLNEYNWILPELCSKKMMIKVSCSDNEQIADTTLALFTIRMDDKDKLLAYYPLDGNTNDEQYCHFYNGINVNNVLYVQDRSLNENGAAEFSGENYVQIPDFNAKFDELTVILWFKAYNLEGKKFILGTNFNEGWVFSSYFWGQLGISLWVDGKGAPDQLWAGGIMTDKWYCLAFTFDGSIAKVYLDGELKSEKKWDNAVMLNQFNSTPIYLGARKGNDFFQGCIDDVRIFNRALALDEIVNFLDVKDEYNKGHDIFSVYPNPAKDKLIINYESTNNVFTEIYLANIFGQKVKMIAEKEIITGISNLETGLADLPSGIYYIVVETPTERKVKKVEVIK